MPVRAYLDHAATSPMPGEVLETYLDALKQTGNPASTHGHGQAASERLEAARENISRRLGADPALVTLTGGGTESVNLAIKGLYWAAQKINPKRNVLLIAEGEHHATIEAAEWLRDFAGAELHWVPIDGEGRLLVERLTEAVAKIGADRIALVSFLMANNEVGTVQPVVELVQVAHESGIPVHVDAIAALGQVPIDFLSLGADAMSVSAHKIGGPVGIGALLLARGAQIESLMHGGSQQRGRSGTQDVAGAVAFAAALDAAYSGDFEDRMARLSALRDRLIDGVTERVSGAQLRGVPVPAPAAQESAGSDRLPGNAHFTFEGCQGDSLVFLLDAAGVSVSVGSACRAGVAEVSHVLLAMGIDEQEAIGSLRFTLSSHTEDWEISALLEALPEAVTRARAAGLS